MTSDCDLLRQYADHGDQPAFAEIVQRQADLVYSVALRVTANSALAQEVTQTVFTLLARRAALLSHYDTLVGWLHTTTRHTAINAVRGEERRRIREHEAATMQDTTIAPEVNWTAIGPLLDEAVAQLRADDQKAILLRFFKNQSHQEIGAALGLTEDTARKRVERALEKLRTYFAARGVKASSVLLAVSLVENSVQAAPVGLVEKITPASLAGIGGMGMGTVSLTALFTFLMSTKTKAIITLVVIAALAVSLVIKLCGPAETAALPTLNTPPTVKAASISIGSVTAQVAAPVVQPAPVIAASSVASTTSVATNDPQAELSTAIPHLIELIQNEQLLTAIKLYMPPSYFEQMPQTVKDQLEQQEKNILADPTTAQTRLAAVQALQSMLNQSPVLNEAGDHATYRLDTDPANPNHPPQEISFVKIDGKWYLVPGANALFF